MFFYVYAADVVQNKCSFNLPTQFEKLAGTKQWWDLASVKLTGTRSHHCFVPFCQTELKMKSVSADEHYTAVG